jgi:hypothetical protein
MPKVSCFCSRIRTNRGGVAVVHSSQWMRCMSTVREIGLGAFITRKCNVEHEKGSCFCSRIRTNHGGVAVVHSSRWMRCMSTVREIGLGAFITRKCNVEHVLCIFYTYYSSNKHELCMRFCVSYESSLFYWMMSKCVMGTIALTQSVGNERLALLTHSKCCCKSRCFQHFTHTYFLVPTLLLCTSCT